MTDAYWHLIYLTTQLLPTLAWTIFVPVALVGLMHRGLRNL